MDNHELLAALTMLEKEKYGIFSEKALTRTLVRCYIDIEQKFYFQGGFKNERYIRNKHSGRYGTY